jgi:hypothetical protein
MDSQSIKPAPRNKKYRPTRAVEVKLPAFFTMAVEVAELCSHSTFDVGEPSKHFREGRKFW